MFIDELVVLAFSIFAVHPQFSLLVFPSCINPPVTSSGNHRFKVLRCTFLNVAHLHFVGKNACDALGGRTKSRLRFAVMQDKHFLFSAEAIVKYLHENFRELESNSSTRIKKKSKKESEALKREVLEFYSREDITKQVMGEFKVLKYSMRDCYAIYSYAQAAAKKKKVGKTLFQEYKPKELIAFDSNFLDEDFPDLPDGCLANESTMDNPDEEEKPKCKHFLRDYLFVSKDDIHREKLDKVFNKLDEVLRLRSVRNVGLSGVYFFL